MSEKYIRENKNSCSIVKGSKTYARISNLEDAVFLRDLLVENNWNLDKIPDIVIKGDDYLVMTVYEDKLCLLAKFRKKPSPQTVSGLVKKHKRNPNNSKYGLNIYNAFGVFYIQKTIAGDEYIFGYYDSLQDAEFVRNFLLDNMWDVSRFEEINYCEDTDDYKVVKVIDDKAYVLGSYDSEDIDLNRCCEEFLSRIYKHRYGMASYPHLDSLKDDIHRLKEEWGVKIKDDYWDFQDVKDDSQALNQIIFTLSPFEQSIYDSIGDGATFEEIKKSLIRYRSKNFEDKIKRNLDKLVENNLIVNDDGCYKKVKE